MARKFVTGGAGQAYASEDGQPRTAEMPCEGCGKPVTVTLPFHGCVMCPECRESEGYGAADAPEFKRL